MIIACMAGMLSEVSDAGQHYPSGEGFNNKVESLRLAIEDLIQTFGEQYTGGQAYLERLQSTDEKSFPTLQREALLANPLVSRASR